MAREISDSGFMRASSRSGERRISILTVPPFMRERERGGGRERSASMTTMTTVEFL